MTLIDLTWIDDADTDRGDPDKIIPNNSGQTQSDCEIAPEAAPVSLMHSRVRVLFLKKSLRKRNIQQKDLMPFSGTVVDLHPTDPDLLLIQFDNGSREWIDYTDNRIFSFV